MAKSDFRKCDECNGFSVSPDGCSESCFVNMNESLYLTDYYYEQRRDGIAKSCKAFQRIISINTNNLHI